MFALIISLALLEYYNQVSYPYNVPGSFNQYLLNSLFLTTLLMKQS